MNLQHLLENFESLPTFPGIKANSTVFAWWDSQGSVQGVRALGFRCGCPNGEAEKLTTHRQCHLEVGALPTFKKLSR